MSTVKEYLSHHGVKGQQWGIRRYQNEDGTLTEEGKKRYGWYYSDQIDRLAKEKNSDKYKKEETRERKQKEYDRAVKKAEASRVAGQLLGYGLLAYSVGSMANLLSGGALGRMSKNALGKAVSGIANSKTIYKMKNSLQKRKQYKKMGAVVLNKKNYKMFGPYI